MREPVPENLRDRMRAPWEAGDFDAVARTLGAPIAAAFAEQVQAPPGSAILDVACGTGGITIPLARRGFRMTGLDLSPTLLAQARDRSAADALDIRFDEGLAEDLPYADASFDAAVSLFGVMFSLRPKQAAAELGRVVTSGGELMLGNWTDAGFSGALRKKMAAHLPPTPAGGAAPGAWGDETYVRETLDPWFTDIQPIVVAAPWVMAVPPEEAAAFFIDSSGHMQLMLPRLDANDADALRQEVTALVIAENRSVDRDRATVLDNSYLRVAARRQ